MELRPEIFRLRMIRRAHGPNVTPEHYCPEVDLLSAGGSVDELSCQNVSGLHDVAAIDPFTLTPDRRQICALWDHAGDRFRLS